MAKRARTVRRTELYTQPPVGFEALSAEELAAADMLSPPRGSGEGRLHCLACGRPNQTERTGLRMYCSTGCALTGASGYTPTG